MTALKARLYRVAGCEACGGTGFAGRICIAECLLVDDEIREAITRRASARDIQAIATSAGMTTMREDGFKKVAAGLTTVEEVLRVVHA